MKKLFRRLIRPLLERQAVRYIRRHRLKVVTVAGSVGKTSTKSAVATVLGVKYRVRVQGGNYNDTVSVPLAVFGLEVPDSITSAKAWLKILARMEKMIAAKADVDVLVLELGTDHPGEIPHFMTYLKPDVGILTAVAEEHMEYFATLEAVAQEETAMARGARQLLVNADDVDEEYRERYLRREDGYLTYGLGLGDYYRFEIHKTAELSGEKGDLVAGGVKIPNVALPVLGAPAVKAALAAAAAAHLLELSYHEIKDGLSKLKPVAGRLQPLRGIEETLLIDDTYNASPKATTAALKLLHRATGRTVAVLGQMNELGDYSQEAHEIVGKAASGVDLLITVARDAEKWLGPAAVAAGLPPDRWKHFDSPYDAGRWLKGQIKKGDTILFKGSQDRVYTEETLKLLLADPADAAKLVRQSPYWLQRKAKQFEVR